MTAPDTPQRERTEEQQAIAAALAAASAVTVRAINLLGRLLDAEDATLTALDAQEMDAKQALIDPQSLEQARQAGQDLDDAKAARAALLPRAVLLTNTCDKATRGLRHTAALQSRLLSGRPFRPLPPLFPEPASANPAPATPRAPRDPDAEPAERPDFYDAPERYDFERLRPERPEPADDLAAMSNGQALRRLARDLSDVAEAATHLAANPADPAEPQPAPYHFRPGETRPFPLPINPPIRPKRPDT